MGGQRLNWEKCARGGRDLSDKGLIRIIFWQTFFILLLTAEKNNMDVLHSHMHTHTRTHTHTCVCAWWVLPWVSHSVRLVTTLGAGVQVWELCSLTHAFVSKSAFWAFLTHILCWFPCFVF
jgi:hypothetical protein